MDAGTSAGTHSVRIPRNVQLVDDTLLVIFKHLELRDLVRCMSVCRHWRQVVSSSPQLWRHIELKLSVTPTSPMDSMVFDGFYETDKENDEIFAAQVHKLLESYNKRRC